MKNTLFFIRLSLALVTLAGALHAQDLRTVQPQPAPPMPVAKADLPAPPGAAIASQALAGQAGLKVVGLVFLDALDQVHHDGWPAIGLPASKIDAKRVPLLAAPGAEQKFIRALGQPVDPRFLQALPALVTQLFRAAGRPFVSVTIPVQDFTNGVLQVLVVEGRLGTVAVAGNHFFSQKSYLSAIRATPGQSIDQQQLDDDLAWIAQNPFRSATITARPGAQVGTTDLVLQAQDRLPWRFYGGYDDTGTRSTGLERVNAGLNWGNVFGRADQFNYQLTADPHFYHSVSHAGTYTAMLPWRDTLTANFTYGKIHAKLPEPFDNTGHSSQVSLRYNHDLPKWGTISQSLVAGFDYKRSDNNLLFSEIPISGNVTHIWEASLAWQANRPDRLGSTSLAATLYGSPGGLDNYNKDAAFDGSRYGAKAQYAYFNLNLTRTTKLPLDLLWVTTFSAQIASTNLLGSEQFTVGGAYTVRGYDDGQVYGDDGLLLRNELQAPALRGLSCWLKNLPADQVVPLVFIDAGVTRDHVNGYGSTSLAGAGVGLRYQVGRYGSLRADYGWKLRDYGASDGGRFHVSASISY